MKGVCVPTQSKGILLEMNNKLVWLNWPKATLAPFLSFYLITTSNIKKQQVTLSN